MEPHSGLNSPPLPLTIAGFDTVIAPASHQASAVHTYNNPSARIQHCTLSILYVKKENMKKKMRNEEKWITLQLLSCPSSYHPSSPVLPSLPRSLFYSISLARWAVTVAAMPCDTVNMQRGSLGLATQTCHHHSASNPKLPINSWAHPHLPEGTVTCPPSVCSIPHSTNPPTAPSTSLYTL